MRNYAGAVLLRRRGRRLRRAEFIPEEASSGVPTDLLSQVGPCAQSGRAGAVQRNGGALPRAGQSQSLGRARSNVVLAVAAARAVVAGLVPAIHVLLSGLERRPVLSEMKQKIFCSLQFIRENTICQRFAIIDKRHAVLSTRDSNIHLSNGIFDVGKFARR
jgi:hypothetical protein